MRERLSPRRLDNVVTNEINRSGHAAGKFPDTAWIGCTTTGLGRVALHRDWTGHLTPIRDLDFDAGRNLPDKFSRPATYRMIAVK